MVGTRQTSLSEEDEGLFRELNIGRDGILAWIFKEVANSVMDTSEIRSYYFELRKLMVSVAKNITIQVLWFR